MKFNPIMVVVVVVAIAAAAYYLHHHNINMKADVKGDNGSKSHMGMKYDAAKDDNA